MMIGFLFDWVETLLRPQAGVESGYGEAPEQPGLLSKA
jgi:hypothetical protein